jgi:hypothetical protein
LRSPLAHLLPAYERDDRAGCLHVELAAVRETIKALEAQRDVVTTPLVAFGRGDHGVFPVGRQDHLIGCVSDLKHPLSASLNVRFGGCSP